MLTFLFILSVFMFFIAKGNKKLICVVLAVLLWRLMYPTYEYSYKMTVTVDTIDGQKTGESIVRLVTKLYPGWLVLQDSTTYKTDVYGESVIVRLDRERYIFATLYDSKDMDFDYPERILYRVFRAPNFYNVTERFGYYERLKNEKAVLSITEYPLIVTFDNINTPQSIRRVDPTNMEATFGQYVSSLKITMEMTDEPVEAKIINVLTWLPEFCNRRFKDHQNSINTGILASQMSAYAFWKHCSN